ncbi:RNase A-like domain-containing protein [Zavarzinia sp.]|uniref:RNase A-like domain-containing protein n=1 Tax=Zavarzinia sp. TaxID=2027920 RepID=UPI00356831DE
MDEDGLTVAITPVQLAAIFVGEEIWAGETRSNRLWGGLKAIGGALELLGAGALLVTPDPSLVTKAGGVALGAHGIDTVQSGLRQAWSGRDTAGLTEAGVTELALGLGASPDNAHRVAVGIDIAVPFAVTAALGVVRVLAIRGGRISLAANEAAQGSRLGGHTIAKHVAMPEMELRARLAASPALKAASTFRSLDVAERTLYQALRANRAMIEAWARSAVPGSRRAFEFTAREVVGEGVVRASGKLETMRRVRFVLKMEAYNGTPYYILTAFPVP